MILSGGKHYGYYKTNRGNSKSNQNGPTYTSLGTLDFELVKNFVITIIKDYET